MKRLLWIALLMPVSLLAQSTTVSTTGVVDTDGFTWANGTYSIQFYPNPSWPSIQSYTWQGAPLTGHTLFNGVLNGSGVFSQSIPSNSAISPSGSQWTFTICPNATNGCFATNISVTGATLDVTSQLNAVAKGPRFACYPHCFGYGTIEVTPNPQPGAVIYNNTTAQALNWTGTVWAPLAGGAANPAPPSFAVQLANSGATAFQADSKILINPATHSFQAPISSGFAYATGYGDGSTNGISACAAAGLSFCSADPSYPTTEQYSQSSQIPNLPNAFHFMDNRSGIHTDLFNNWGFTANNYGDPIINAENHLYFNSQYRTGSISSNTHNTGFNITYNSTAPGYDITVARGGSEELLAGNAFVIQDSSNSSGITQAQVNSHRKYGIGDNDGIISDVQSNGGWLRSSDEGTLGIETYIKDSTDRFTASCVTGCTSGSTAITTGSFGGSGNGTQGVGHYMFDSTASSLPCTVTAIATGVASTISAVTCNETVTTSIAWGTLGADCNAPISNTPPTFSTSITCTVNVTSGTFVTSTAPDANLLCFAGNQHECTRPTAVSGSGTVSITMPVRLQHNSGSYVFQGGMTGYGLNFTSFNQGNLSFWMDVVGATDAHTLQALVWRPVGATPITVMGLFNSGNSITGVMNMASLSNSGTTVSFTYNASGSTLSGPNRYTKSTIVISGASDPAFNGNCTNLTWSNTTVATCTLSSITGTHTAASAMANLGTNSAILRPVAEVTDVQDYNASACLGNGFAASPCVDGTFTLEPNILPFASGHTVEQPHHISTLEQPFKSYDIVQNPFNQGLGFAAGVGGPGAIGGSLGSVSQAVGLFSNSQTDSYYVGNGGFHIAPNMLNLPGVYNDGLNFDHYPGWGSDGWLILKPNSSQGADPNFCPNILNLYNAGLTTNNTLVDCPSTGNLTWNLNSGMTYKGPAVDLSQVQSVTLPRVTIETPSGFTSGVGYNYAPYSNNLLGATWHSFGGSGTIVCNITDDLGNPACTMTTGLNYLWSDNPSVGYTNLSASTTYTQRVRMRGHAGGELVFLGPALLTSPVNLTTSWQDYCSGPQTTGATSLNNFANINLYTVGSIDISNVVTRPGTTCGPSILTTNNQFTTATNINSSPSISSPYYTTALEFSNGTCTTAATINPANGNRQNITLTNGDTCALTFTQPNGMTANVTLKVIQSSVSTFNGGISGCKWPGGAVPTITQTSAAVDFVGVYLDGTSAFCTVSQNFQ